MSAKIRYGGVHHLALVCSDMQRTVEFYTKVLGMELKKGFDLEGGFGQHFFFDMGGGNDLAFFWFRDAEKRAPGVAAPAHLVGSRQGSFVTAHGSMNHIAFSVPPEEIDAYREMLVAKGVKCTPVVNHDDVVTGADARTSRETSDRTWIRSFYFFDPDGIMLEFCATLKPGSASIDLPVDAQGIKSDGSKITGAR